ncbi:MAG: polysaccharide biosynthesis/export family protein [Armatimonadota bacterium]
MATNRIRREALIPVNTALVTALIIGTCFLNGTGIAAAQTVPPASVSVPPAGGTILSEDPEPYVSNKDYKLAPDDTIDITVVDHPEANASVVVAPNGTIKYQRIGQIKVSGMTTSQLEDRITKVLGGGGDVKKAYYINPQVLAYVRTRQLRTVSVLGSGTRTPGKTTLKEGWRLFDLMAAIGGVPTDRLEFYDVQLIRGGDTVRKIDLTALYAQEPDANVLLRADDIVLINALDESRTTMQVIGEVAKPGALLVPRDGSLATVLGQAQPNPRAHLSSAKIDRNGEIIPVDLSRWFKDGQVDSDVKLQPGDRLIIPENKRLYAIYGPTGKSGTQVYPDDRKLTVLSALADAGGATEGLELQDVQVIRPSQQDGVAPTVIKVDVKDMLKKGELKNDVPILPGDIIYVPAAKRSRGINSQQIFNFLGVIPVLGFLFRR